MINKRLTDSALYTVLLCALCIFLCSCGKTVQTVSEKTETVQVTETQKPDKDFSVGEYDGNVYKNEFLGIVFSPGPEWAVLSSEQMAEINIGFSEDERVDLYAMYGNNEKSVELSYEKTDKDTLMYEEGFFANNENHSMKQTYIDIGCAVIDSYVGRTDFSGEKRYYSFLIFEQDGVTYFSKTVIISESGYIAKIQVKTAGEDSTDELLSFFSVLEKADDELGDRSFDQ